MAHIPINHPLRSVYRFLALLAGLYVLAFGVVGVARGAGHPFFGRDDVYALGLRTNLAFAVLSIVVGAVVVVGAVLGGNLDHFLNLGAGLVFLVAGLAMLATLRTTANLLNFQVSTCVVSFVIGLVLFAAGLYGKVSTEQDAQREELLRTGATR